MEERGIANERHPLVRKKYSEVRAGIVELFKAARTTSVRLSMIGESLLIMQGSSCYLIRGEPVSQLGTRWYTLDQDIKSLSMYKEFVVNIGKLLIDEPISKSVFPRRWISTA
jgi:hypothetical protein